MRNPSAFTAREERTTDGRECVIRIRTKMGKGENGDKKLIAYIITGDSQDSSSYLPGPSRSQGRSLVHAEGHESRPCHERCGVAR